jgi:hypothetical protein
VECAPGLGELPVFGTEVEGETVPGASVWLICRCSGMYVLQKGATFEFDFDAM